MKGIRNKESDFILAVSNFHSREIYEKIRRTWCNNLLPINDRSMLKGIFTAASERFDQFISVMKPNFS